MAGALIVVGDFADVPEIAAASERVLVVNEVMFDYEGMIERYDTVWPEAQPAFAQRAAGAGYPPAVGRGAALAHRPGRARGQSPPRAR